MRERRNSGHLGWLGTSRFFLIIVLVGGVALIAVGVYGLYRNFGGLDRVQAADQQMRMAPAFSLPDLDGGTHTLARFLEDKPLLLEFMDPTCPHCVQMAPILTRLHAAYGTRVRFLTVAFESRNDPRRVRRFVERHMHSWPYLMGNMDVARPYRVDGVPSFFLIGSEGQIRGILVGSATYEAMSRGLEAVLAGR
jgi:thiol-disulfide isomerase/thioredoxin